MRVLLLGSLLAIVVAVFFWKSPAPIPSVAPSPTPTLTVSTEREPYRISWVAGQSANITLIPNFTQKRTARSLTDANKCKAVINAGFYTKDTQTTGLFITGGKMIRRDIPNALLNGYFVIDQNNAASIRSSPPDASVRIALQTGPILLQDGSPMKLVIRDDEFARRVSVYRGRGISGGTYFRRQLLLYQLATGGIVRCSCCAPLKSLRSGRCLGDRGGNTSTRFPWDTPRL